MGRHPEWSPGRSVLPEKPYFLQVSIDNPEKDGIISKFDSEPTAYPGEFPSGQRGQTVNLLRFASMARTRPPPPKIADLRQKIGDFYFFTITYSLFTKIHPAIFGK